MSEYIQKPTVSFGDLNTQLAQPAITGALYGAGNTNQQVFSPIVTGALQGAQSGTNFTTFGDPRISDAGGAILGGNTGSGGSTARTVAGDTRLQELQKTDRNPSQESEYQRLLAELQGAEANQENIINTGWDNLIGQYNDILNTGLPGQRQAQEGIANTTYNQGINQLGVQRDASTRELEGQRKKNLRDLSSNISNLFQSGNVYLGARGAGDSSAADQYSYALTKLGSRGRSDIIGQADQRMNQIKDIFNSETNRLESEKNIRMSQIADWFNAAQNEIRQAIGQAGVGRSQDLQAASQNVYNRALQAVQMLQQESANRRAALESWALSNSKSIQEGINNLQTVQQLPSYQGLQGGMPSISGQSLFGSAPVGYGMNGNREETDIFGNPIR